MGHNSLDYAHVVTEAIKLAFADRERYYGDPRFVNVPIETLLSDAYAQRRRAMIRPDRAWPEMPPVARSPVLRSRRAPTPTRGSARGRRARHVLRLRDGQARQRVLGHAERSRRIDTPVIPGTGLCPSSRGSQSWADPAHRVVGRAGQAAAPHAQSRARDPAGRQSDAASARPAATCRRRRCCRCS